MNSEIQDFRDSFRELLSNFKTVCSQTSSDPFSAIDSSRASLFTSSDGLTSAVARYWRYEAAQPDLVAVAPLRAAGRLLGDVAELLTYVALVVDGESPYSVGETARTQIRNISESSLAIATILDENLKDHGIGHSCEKIYAKINELRTKFLLSRTALNPKRDR